MAAWGFGCGATIFACALVASPAVPAPSRDAGALRLAVSDGPVSTTVYVAEHEGYFRTEGVAVTDVACASGLACLRLLEAGETDLATVAELPVVLNPASDEGLSILATISSSVHQIKLIARRSAGIGSAGSVTGKRIGTANGTSAQYFLDSWLVFNDLDPKAVTIIDSAPDALPREIVQHQVDAIAIWEPLASEALERLGTDGVALPNPRVYTQYFNLVAPRATVVAREADIARVLRALTRAQVFIKAEPGRTGAILKARLHVDRRFADASLEEHDFRVRLDQSLVTTMSNEARWAARSGLSDAATLARSPLDLIATGPLRLANPGAVNLER